MPALPTNVSLTWKVRASNARGDGAWSRSLTFKIVPPSPAKALTAFSFEGLAPPVIGGIDEPAHIAGTPQVSGTTPNSFANPVTYRVTAATTQDYVVTVTVAAPCSPSAIPTRAASSPPSCSLAIPATVRRCSAD